MPLVAQVAQIEKWLYLGRNNANVLKISIHSIPDTYNSNIQPEFVHSQYFCSYPISNI